MCSRIDLSALLDDAVLAARQTQNNPDPEDAATTAAIAARRVAVAYADTDPAESARWHRIADRWAQLATASRIPF